MRHRRRIAGWLAGILILMGLGCATPGPQPPALSQDDIQAMLAAGQTDEVIIRKIDETGTVFLLSADDVVRLRAAGFSDRLVTYMLDTKTRAAVARERNYWYLRSYPYPYPYYGYGSIYHHHHRPQHKAK